MKDIRPEYSDESTRPNWMEKKRPKWQDERGERHGNNRKWKAKEKWIERKRSRKRDRSSYFGDFV